MFHFLKWVKLRMTILDFLFEITFQKKIYVWSIALYGSETWTLRKFKWKYLESFKMWCWKRMEKIKWSKKVTNEQALDRIGEKRTLLNNTLH